MVPYLIIVGAVLNNAEAARLDKSSEKIARSHGDSDNETKGIKVLFQARARATRRSYMSGRNFVPFWDMCGAVSN